MTESGGEGTGRPPGGGAKERERRARQAEALRRNLARRKAQARGRAEDGGGEPPKGKTREP